MVELLPGSGRATRPDCAEDVDPALAVAEARHRERRVRRAADSANRVLLDAVLAAAAVLEGRGELSTWLPTRVAQAALVDNHAALRADAPSAAAVRRAEAHGAGRRRERPRRRRR